MGKKSRLKRERRLNQLSMPCFLDQDNLSMSFLVPGTPKPGEAEEATALFQNNIKKSPAWKEIVDYYGEQKAEEILKKCKAEIK